MFFSRGAYVTTVYICINYDNLLFSDFDMPRIKDPIWKKFKWKTGVRLGFPESIVNLAVAIVGGASISGGLERHFSSLGFSYGTLRAQLGIEKAGKLAFLYRELNQ